MTAVSPELMAEFDVPMGLGELVLVDTTQEVDVRFIAEQVSRALRQAARKSV